MAIQRSWLGACAAEVAAAAGRAMSSAEVHQLLDLIDARAQRIMRDTVFPAGVGMNRGRLGDGQPRRGVPRRRGDEPPALGRRARGKGCSPQAWG